ncbi:hypothetical protein [Nisaea sediminum]|uniref:hypothetical protein n=1 Tax=Nisaea sediminum TaxID=2775867 RepID=UPI0018662F50|nr:hypothetical protein [Nisaea sediminum]
MFAGAVAAAVALTSASGADETLPETCRLDVAEADLRGGQAESVGAAWAGAVESTLAVRDQLRADAGSGSGSVEQQRRKRRNKLALLQGRVVGYQQQIFIALGPEGHDVAGDLTERLDACIEEIRSALRESGE